MLGGSKKISCPYCGEEIEIFIDNSIDVQDYIEDCSVCCRPIELSISIVGDDVFIVTRRDDD